MLHATEKRRPGGSKCGRPTTSRNKPPYEMPVKGSRFCSVCRQQGHKSTTVLSEAIRLKPRGKHPGVLFTV